MFLATRKNSSEWSCESERNWFWKDAEGRGIHLTCSLVLNLERENKPTEHGQRSSKFVICVILFVIRVVLLSIVMFYVLFMCKCVLPPGVNPIAVDKYIISYHIINKSCVSIVRVPAEIRTNTCRIKIRSPASAPSLLAFKTFFFIFRFCFSSSFSSLISFF
jgi:hypothetical protein